MRQLAAVLIGFVAACVIAAIFGADFTSAVAIGLFYTVPILIGLVLPWWGPVSMAVTVVIVMLIAGPFTPKDQQGSVISWWAWLWVWITLAAVLTVGYTWIEQKRKARKARR